MGLSEGHGVIILEGGVFPKVAEQGAESPNIMGIVLWVLKSYTNVENRRIGEDKSVCVVLALWD